MPWKTSSVGCHPHRIIDPTAGERGYNSSCPVEAHNASRAFELQILLVPDFLISWIFLSQTNERRRGIYQKQLDPYARFGDSSLLSTTSDARHSRRPKYLSLENTRVKVILMTELRRQTPRREPNSYLIIANNKVAFIDTGHVLTMLLLRSYGGPPR